jgi:glycosyltransferase involved in cell wall biosynthesis
LNSIYLQIAPLANVYTKALPSAKVVVKKGLFYLHWEQMVLPSLCREYQIDILHCPINFGLPLFNSCPQISTIHDVIDYKFGRGPDFQTRMLHWLTIKGSTAIITVSEFSKQDLAETLNVPKEKIHAILEAGDDIERQPASRNILNSLGIDSPYFFYIGGWEHRKNIRFLLKSFARANLVGIKLVIAGEKNQETYDCVMKLASDLDISDRVIGLKWLEDDVLAGLYAHALAFVYPSTYEGFGLQLCEGMSYGCPLLSSNRTSLPEVLGPGGALFDPENSDELAGLLQKVANQPKFREELKQRSIERGKDFTWEKTAQETIQLYQSILKRPQSIS